MKNHGIIEIHQPKLTAKSTYRFFQTITSSFLAPSSKTRSHETQINKFTLINPLFIPQTTREIKRSSTFLSAGLSTSLKTPRSMYHRTSNNSNYMVKKVVFQRIPRVGINNGTKPFAFRHILNFNMNKLASTIYTIRTLLAVSFQRIHKPPEKP